MQGPTGHVWLIVLNAGVSPIEPESPRRVQGQNIVFITGRLSQISVADVNFMLQQHRAG